MGGMSDEGEHEGHMHGVPVVGIPAAMLADMQHHHSAQQARAEDRYRSSMRWLEGLDVEGLMALRYVLRSEADEAYGNSRHYDGMAIMLLRAKGVNPVTGLDDSSPAVLLQGGDGR